MKVARTAAQSAPCRRLFVRPRLNQTSMSTSSSLTSAAAAASLLQCRRMSSSSGGQSKVQSQNSDEKGLPPSTPPSLKERIKKHSEKECIQVHGYRCMSVVSDGFVDPSTLDLSWFERRATAGTKNETQNRLSLLRMDSDTETETESDAESSLLNTDLDLDQNDDELGLDQTTQSISVSGGGTRCTKTGLQLVSAESDFSNQWTESRTALAALALENPYAPMKDDSWSTYAPSSLKKKSTTDMNQITPVIAYEIWHSPPEVYDWVYGFEADCEPPDRHNLRWHFLYKAWGYYGKKERRHRCAVYSYMKSQRRCANPLFWGSVFDLENTFRVELQLLCLHMWFVKVRMVDVASPIGGARLSKKGFTTMIQQLGNRFNNHIQGTKGKWQNDCQQACLHFAVSLDHAMEDYNEGDDQAFSRVIWSELYLSNRDMEHDVLYLWTKYIMRELDRLKQVSDEHFLNGWWRFGPVPNMEERQSVRDELMAQDEADGRDTAVEGGSDKLLSDSGNVENDDDSLVDDSLGYIHKMQMKQQKEREKASYSTLQFTKKSDNSNDDSGSSSK